MAARKLIKYPDVKLISSSGLEIDKYESGCNLLYEGKQIPLAMSYGGVIISTNDSNLIVDDGYRYNLVKAGYIVYKNYDKERSSDLDDRFTDKMKDKFIDIMNDMYPAVIECPSVDNEFNITHDDYEIAIRINTVEEVVEMNHKRKDNDLPFYPFNKDMDKYGTVYVSVFYKKKSPTGSYPKEIVDTLIKNVMVKFGADYHYTSVRVRSSVIKWSGI